MTVTYEVFGNLKSGHEANIRERVVEDEVGWPDAELTNCVAHVSIRSFGDDPDDAFIMIQGTDRDDAANAYIRVADVMRPIMKSIWGTT